MQGKITIKIDENITEQALVESCLNQISSGYDSSMVLAFYALGKRWHGGKLVYYLNLLEKEMAKTGSSSGGPDTTDKC